MKKKGVFAIEAVIAIAVLLLVAVVIFAYRGAIADKFASLRSKPAATATPTPHPTSPITPLPTSTFPAPGATAAPGSIAVLPAATSTPKSVRIIVDGKPLPTTGPADMMVFIAALGAVAAYGTYRYVGKVS